MREHGIFTFIVLGLLGQASSQTEMSRCESLLSYGGVCVDKMLPCPVETYEYSILSNYVGCLSVYKKCCARSTPTSSVNPGGITPPVARTCGLGSLEPTSRILDGTLTGACDWPFVVSIRSLLSDSAVLSYNTTSHTCQGVLVQEQWVLTSAFCILSAGHTRQEAPSRILVIAGEYNTSAIDLDPLTGRQQEQVISVANVFIHPNYPFLSLDDIIPFLDGDKVNSDGVALIKLARPISGRCAGIACLPTVAEAANRCAGYDTCVITGWGFNSELSPSAPTADLSSGLLLGRVRLSSPEACDFLSQRMNLQGSRPQGSICQSPRTSNTDSCLGDEGGPIMCSNGNYWTVRGVMPFNLCVNGRYNLFVTDVSSYLEWIQNIITSFSA